VIEVDHDEGLGTQLSQLLDGGNAVTADDALRLARSRAGAAASLSRRSRSLPSPHRPGRWSLRLATALVVVGAVFAVIWSQAVPGSRPPSPAAPSTTLPAGVMSAARACSLVVDNRPGFYTHVEQVHLVLTTYAKGEPVESGGDISDGMPASTLVWVVEVHAKAINWNHSEFNNQSPKSPDTDYSVVMNARTGKSTDSGECRCWPLPLGTVGTLVSLPPSC
jgi:hypothetical protein